MHNVDETQLFVQMQTMKEIIDSTMEMIISRHQKHPSYPYIDVKIDAITGIDYFDEEGIRDSKHIYSWIQGRGLEAIIHHIKWYDNFNGYVNPNKEELLSIATGVAFQLDTLREERGGHLNFLLSQDPCDDDRFTMSDLFCSRGLYAFYQMAGENEKAHKAKKYLIDVVEAIINGNFYNDQHVFNDENEKMHDEKKASYASFMLALGSLHLLAEVEQEKRAPELAKQLISYVLEFHVNIKNKWKSLEENTIVEWITHEGSPYHTNLNTILVSNIRIQQVIASF